MKDGSDTFINLFKEACHKCFGVIVSAQLSETESRHFSNIIFDKTGLVIGAKSLKNYSAYALNLSEGKIENPSTATLDTLARYVLNAPYTDEVQRKSKEANFPYWFQYKNQLATLGSKTVKERKTGKWFLWLIIIAGIAGVFFISRLFHVKNDEEFIDKFQSLQEDSLKARGWLIQSKDTEWWNQRNQNLKVLTLFTLRGDNWPDSANPPRIKNLMIRKIPSDCFTTEIHLEQFIPKVNWQQAGILLMEDTLLTSKTVRLSFAYNDFFGGFVRPKEIIIQAVSFGGSDGVIPEEIAHIPLFKLEAGQDSLVENNMKYAALKIEKRNNHLRFLYSSSPVENFAFKEAFVKDLFIKPKYVALFALQGFVSNTSYIPVHITYFKQSALRCE